MPAELRLGTGDYARYPFLKESMDYGLGLLRGISLDSLGKAEVLGYSGEAFLEAARKRVAEGLERGVSPPLLDLPPEVSIASFMVSLIAIRATEDRLLYSRFSMAEARRSEALLLSEIRGNPMGREIARLVFQSLTGSPLEGYQGGFMIGFTSYLSFAPITEPSWKLVNRWLYMGMVYLKDTEIAHIFREAAARRVEGIIASMPRPSVEGAMQGLVEEALRHRPRPRAVSRPGEVPPCVKHQLEMLRNGQNAPHMGRFLVAAYFLHAGLSEDEIVEFFRTAPDFNERITRYQIRQIARKGSEGYMVPGCSKLATLGLCYRDETCNNIRNPVQYGRVRPQTSSS